MQGLASLTGIAAETRSATASDPEAIPGVQPIVVGQGPDMVESLQDAIDGAEYNARIEVDPSYDPSVDTWPISFSGVDSNVVEVVGRGQRTRIDVPAGKQGFRIDTVSNYTSVTLRNLLIVSNSTAVNVNGTPFFTIRDCEIRSGGAGIYIHGTGGSPWSTVIDDCLILNPGGPGILCEGTEVNALNIWDTTVKEPERMPLFLDGTAVINIWGGNFDGGSEYNHFRDTASLNIFGAYFESSNAEGKGGTGTLGNDFRKIRGGLVHGCYFNGWDSTDYAVNLNRNEPCRNVNLTGCSFQGYREGFVSLNKASSNDINRSSHYDAEDVGVIANEGWSPVRSNGILAASNGGMPLEYHDGAFVGDVGMESGESDGANGKDLGIWTGSAWMLLRQNTTVD